MSFNRAWNVKVFEWRVFCWLFHNIDYTSTLCWTPHNFNCKSVVCRMFVMDMKKKKSVAKNRFVDGIMQFHLHASSYYPSTVSSLSCMFYRYATILMKLYCFCRAFDLVFRFDWRSIDIPEFNTHKPAQNWWRVQNNHDQYSQRICFRVLFFHCWCRNSIRLRY